MRLNKQQIFNIPALLQEHTAGQIASMYGTTRTTINYWIRRLRMSGTEIDIRPGPRPMDLSTVNTTLSKE